MAGRAQVRTIQALPALQASVRRFQEEARAALTELDMVVRRTAQWIQHDQKQYWNQAIRRGRENIAEKQNELDHARMSRRVGDNEASCIVEKRAVEAAKRRLQLSEEKAETVRRWSHEIEHELTEYRGLMAQFQQWLDADCPKAVAVLERLARALEAYVALDSDSLPPAVAAVAEEPHQEELAAEQQAAEEPSEPASTEEQQP